MRAFKVYLLTMCLTYTMYDIYIYIYIYIYMFVCLFTFP